MDQLYPDSTYYICLEPGVIQTIVGLSGFTVHAKPTIDLG